MFCRTRPPPLDSFAEFGYEEDASGKLRTPATYRFKASSLRANAELDYAAVEVETSSVQRPLDLWGWLQVEIVAEPRPGEHVNIIQHPQGGPTQIALTANQVVNVFEHRLQYTTDTLPGSSGSRSSLTTGGSWPSIMPGATCSRTTAGTGCSQRGNPTSHIMRALVEGGSGPKR